MEKKNKIIIILSIIIAILLIALGVMFFIFKDQIFNDDNEEQKESKSVDWKTEYYNKLKELEKDDEDIEYAFIYLEDKKVPILVVTTNNYPKINYDFFTIDSKVKKIGEDSFNTENQIDVISKKDNNYYFTSIKANSDETDVESITVSDIKIKKDKIVFEKKETLDVDMYKNNFESSFEEKFGSVIKFKEISDYEYIDDVKKDKDSSSNIKEEVAKVEPLIEYDKKYVADGTGDYDKGIYFIFYENGKLEYSENMCEGFYDLDGTYKIEGERIIVNIPESLNGDGDWALKIISKDKLKFDESYRTFDYVCGFANGFVLE